MSCTEEIMKLTHILWLPLKNSWYSLTTPPLVYASNFSVNPGLFQESVLLLEKVFLGFVVSWSGSVTVGIQSTSSTERPTEASNEKNLLLDSYDVSKHTHTHTHTLLCLHCKYYNRIWINDISCFFDKDWNSKWNLNLCPSPHRSDWGYQCIVTQ